MKSTGVFAGTVADAAGMGPRVTEASLSKGLRALVPFPEAIRVAEGSLVEVASGTVKMETESGDLLVIQGPAAVEFPEAQRPQLLRGWLWIDAEKSKEPFQVEAGALTVRDIGTRFGVRVPESGPVEVHLVSGRIEVLDSTGAKRLGEMKKAGEAFGFTQKGRGVEYALAPDPFPGLPDLLKSPATYRTAVLGQSPVGYWLLDAPVESKVSGSGASPRESSATKFFGWRVSAVKNSGCRTKRFSTPA